MFSSDYSDRSQDGKYKSRLWRFVFNGLYKKFKSLPIIQKHLYVRQFIKFAVAGAIFTIVDFGIYIILTRVFSFFAIHYLWANFIGTATAATGNFFMNKNWAFRNYEDRAFVQYIKFWVAVIAGIVLYQYLLQFFVETTNLYDILGKAIAVSIVMLVRFGMHKFWVFRVTNHTNSVANHYE